MLSIARHMLNVATIALILSIADCAWAVDPNPLQSAILAI